MQRRAEHDRNPHDTLTLQSSPPDLDQAMTKTENHTADSAGHTTNCPKAKPSRNDLDETYEPSAWDSQYHFLPLSITGTVDEFKKLKSARGSAAHVISRCDGDEAVELSTLPIVVTPDVPHTKPNTRKSQNTTPVLASLRNRLEATRSVVQCGRLMRAWIDLGSIVREADLLVCSETKQILPDDDPSTWRSLWNDILYLESQLGLALGRPTSLFLMREPHKKIDTDPAPDKEVSLNATRLDLYCYTQSLLSLDVHDDITSSDFLERARTILFHEPFNRFGLCTTDEDSAAARDLQLHIHLLFMVIYCRLASMCEVHAREGQGPVYLGSEPNDAARSMGLNQPRQKLAYCRKMFRSAKFVVNIFINLFSEADESFELNWMRCHSAFIAANLLGIAKLRHEVEWNSTTKLLRSLETVFAKLAQKQPSCSLFSLAISRLQDLNSVKEPTSETTLKKHSGIKHRKRQNPVSNETSPNSSILYSQDVTTENETCTSTPAQRPKRERREVETPDHIDQGLLTSFGSNISDNEQFDPISGHGVSFAESVNNLGYYQDDQALFSQASSFMSTGLQSTATSFCDSDIGVNPMSGMGLTHPGPPFAYPFPYHSIHPPMMWYNPAMLPNDHIIVSDTVGMHLLPPRRDPDNPSLAQGAPSSQRLDSGTPATREELTRLTSSVSQPFPLPPEERRSCVDFPSHKGNHGQPSEAHGMNWRPGADRRRSAEALHTVAQAQPSTASMLWQRCEASNPLGDRVQNASRDSGADDTERAQPPCHDRAGQSFCVPVTGEPTTPTKATSHLGFQMPPEPIPEGANQSFYGLGLRSQQDQARLLSPLRHEFTFSCHQQEEYVPRHGPWRQMNVNTGVSGGP